MQKINEILGRAKNVLFQQKLKCICCKNEIINPPEPRICDNCFKELKIINNPCVRCGEIMAQPNQFCANCKKSRRNKEKNYLDFNRSMTTYDGEIKKLIWKLKYENAKYLKTPLAYFLTEAFKKTDFKPDIVVCVPICEKRFKKRGYNQAELLAEVFCKENNLNFRNNILKRIKETESQIEKTYNERAENLKGAFDVVFPKDVKDKTVLVIDDVYTTGATLNECAKVLKRAGAKSVLGLTIAHTEKMLKFEESDYA